MMGQGLLQGNQGIVTGASLYTGTCALLSFSCF